MNDTNKQIVYRQINVLIVSLIFQDTDAIAIPTGIIQKGKNHLNILLTRCIKFILYAMIVRKSHRNSQKFTLVIC